MYGYNLHPRSAQSTKERLVARCPDVGGGRGHSEGEYACNHQVSLKGRRCISPGIIHGQETYISMNLKGRRCISRGISPTARLAARPVTSPPLARAARHQSSGARRNGKNAGSRGVGAQTRGDAAGSCDSRRRRTYRAAAPRHSARPLRAGRCTPGARKGVGVSRPIGAIRPATHHTPTSANFHHLPPTPPQPPPAPTSAHIPPQDSSLRWPTILYSDGLLYDGLQPLYSHYTRNRPLNHPSR